MNIKSEKRENMNIKKAICMILSVLSILPLAAFRGFAAYEMTLMPNMTYAKMAEYQTELIDGFEKDKTVFSSPSAAYYDTSGGFEGERWLCADSPTGECSLRISFTKHLDIKGSSSLAFAILPHNADGGSMSLEVSIYTKDKYTYSSSISSGVTYGVFLSLDKVSDTTHLQYIDIKLISDGACSFKIDDLCKCGKVGNSATPELIEMKYTVKGGELKRVGNALSVFNNSNDCYIISDKFSYLSDEYRNLLKISLNSKIVGEFKLYYSLDGESTDNNSFTERLAVGDNTYRLFIKGLGEGRSLSQIKLAFESEDRGEVIINEIELTESLLSDGQSFEVKCTGGAVVVSGEGTPPVGCDKMLLCRLSVLDGRYETCAELEPSEKFEFKVPIEMTDDIFNKDICSKYYVAYVGGGVVLKSTTCKFPSGTSIFGRKNEKPKSNGKKGMVVYLAHEAIKVGVKQAVVPVSMDALLSDTGDIVCGRYKLDRESLEELDRKISALEVNNCTVNIKLTYSGGVPSEEKADKYISLLSFLAQRYGTVCEFTLSEPLNHNTTGEDFGAYTEKCVDLICASVCAVTSINANAEVTVILDADEGIDECDFLYSLKNSIDILFKVGIETGSPDYDIAPLLKLGVSELTVYAELNDEKTAESDYEKLYNKYKNDDAVSCICLATQTDTDKLIGLIKPSVSEDGVEFSVREELSRAFTEIDDKTEYEDIVLSSHTDGTEPLSNRTSLNVAVGGGAICSPNERGFSATLGNHAESASYIKLSLKEALNADGGICLPLSVESRDNITELGIKLIGEKTVYGVCKLDADDVCVYLPCGDMRIDEIIISCITTGECGIEFDLYTHSEKSEDELAESDISSESDEISSGQSSDKTSSVITAIVVTAVLVVLGVGACILVVYGKKRRDKGSQ